MSTDEEKEESSLATMESGVAPGFGDKGAFELLQRQAQVLAKSQLVPKEFQGNIANCVIALEMAGRIGASPLAVTQNLYIVHGKPGWSSQFIIAAINSTKKFTPLRYEMTGEGESRACIAWAIEIATGERLESPQVSITMASMEGWLQKNGSKWKTMPDLMLRYRSATFFGRLYAPEVLMGMQTYEEVIDVDATVESPTAEEIEARFTKPKVSEAEITEVVEPQAEEEPDTAILYYEERVKTAGDVDALNLIFAEFELTKPAEKDLQMITRMIGNRIIELKEEGGKGK